jgi:hypothetical protein
MEYFLWIDWALNVPNQIALRLAQNPARHIVGETLQSGKQRDVVVGHDKPIAPLVDEKILELSLAPRLGRLVDSRSTYRVEVRPIIKIERDAERKWHSRKVDVNVTRYSAAQQC